MYTCCSCGVSTQLEDLVKLPRDAETQEEWANMYRLSLNIKPNVVDHYVCKSHLSKTEGDANEFMVEPMEVKQEIEETAMDESPLIWREAKEEPHEGEVDYASLFPYEAEQTSYDTFGEDTDFQVDKYEDGACQPSTSTAGTSSSAVSDDSPFYYPELSDGQIYAFCVKNSSNLSGYSSFECGLCPQDFANMDTRPIRRHLHMKHSITVQNVILNGHDGRLPKFYEPLSNISRERADQELCQFFLKNGMPLKAVHDRNLEMLAFNFNSEYTMPSIDTLYDYTQQIADSRVNSTIEDHDGPLTVTFDTTSFNNTQYLAFTVSYRNMQNQLKQAIFLRELEPIQPIVPTIISIIKKEAGSPKSPISITNIVSGKAEYEDALEDMGSFKQVMVCFSQNINKFAEALISHPVFSSSLKTLREFIKLFPTLRDLWAKFKGFIVKKRTYGEYPELDEGHWYTTLDFLTKCLHMHRLFREFSLEHSQHLKYIGVDDNVNMVYLHSLLNLCKATLKSMVDQKATIVEVIPSVGEINASLGITTSRPEVIAEVTHLFNNLLLPFVEQSDLHRFAVFLHPQYHGGDVLPELEWESIRTSIARQIALREAAYDTNGLGSLATPSLRATASADREVNDFRSHVSRSRCDNLQPLDWWEHVSNRFPRLYKYARELLQIPAFAVNASFYLGEYGLLTYSLQEIEPSKRSTLLRASGEMVDFRSKGDIMTKQICVKRKRDANCPEDSWYNPIDVRALRAPDLPPMEEPVPVPLGQWKKHSILSTYHRAGMYSQLSAQRSAWPKKQNVSIPAPQNTYMETERLQPHVKLVQTAYPRRTPQPSVQKQVRYSVPVSQQAGKEPKVEPKIEPADEMTVRPPILSPMRAGVARRNGESVMSMMPKRVAPDPKFMSTRPYRRSIEPSKDPRPFGRAAPLQTVITLPTSQKKYYAVKTTNPSLTRRVPPSHVSNVGPVRNSQTNRTVLFNPASRIISTSAQPKKVYYVRSGTRTGPSAEK